MDCQRLFPASLPLLMMRSSSAAASAAAIDMAGSPNESTSPSAASRFRSSISSRVGSAVKGRQPFSPRLPNSFCGAPSAGAVSCMPAGTPGCSKVGIAQNMM